MMQKPSPFKRRKMSWGSAVNSTSTNFALARYQTNGSLDESFETDGKVITDFGGAYSAISDIVIQSSGKITAVGSALVEGVRSFALARYTKNGELDTTFDIDGKAVTTFETGIGGSVANAAALETTETYRCRNFYTHQFCCCALFTGTAIADFGATAQRIYQSFDPDVVVFEASTDGLRKTLGPARQNCFPHYDGTQN